MIKIDPGVYMHKKTGSFYRVVSTNGLIEKDGLDGDQQVVYARIPITPESPVWVRPASEFAERFEMVAEMQQALLRRTGHLGMVTEFHAKFGLQYLGGARMLEGELKEFRQKFMQEELNEWAEAHEEGDLEKALDALIDLQYVLLGTAYLQGLGGVFSEAFDLVHRANMAKVRASDASESKRGTSLDVVKPAGWSAPDLSRLVLIAKQSGNSLL